MLPCLIFEDDHLLVVNKPAGLNTHAPSPYAGEGLYDWLRHREPRWARLAILHRLDKETSGVLVFGKTPLANRSLTQQFTAGHVRKKYLLLTDRAVKQQELRVESSLVRVGEKHLSRPRHSGGEVAETCFRQIPGGRQSSLSPIPGLGCGAPVSQSFQSADCSLRMLEAYPLTGRTHQIRVHAAQLGFPILGDLLYRGTPAPRVCLHAAELTLKHPAYDQEMTFRAPVDFGSDARLPLHTALIEPGATDSCRVIQGASDGWAGWYVDRLGDYLLSQSTRPLEVTQRAELARLMTTFSIRGAYHKLLNRQVRRASSAETSPQLVLGAAAPDRFVIHENGLRFELSFAEGYSVGLFLDQRDNRRRLLTGHIAAGFSLGHNSSAGASVASPAGPASLHVLNTFAYTCGFSVAAAQVGACTTSLDLSRKYLDWGKGNFALNELEARNHDFIFGDVQDWLRRLAKKQRSFDVILLDPPTFSQSKTSGVFRAERDFGKLVEGALPLLRPGGVLFASTNAANWPPEQFLDTVEAAIHSGRRKILQKHYVPQPPDFPISRAEPGYLKTVWLKCG